MAHILDLAKVFLGKHNGILLKRSICKMPCTTASLAQEINAYFPRKPEERTCNVTSVNSHDDGTIVFKVQSKSMEHTFFARFRKQDLHVVVNKNSLDALYISPHDAYNASRAASGSRDSSSSDDDPFMDKEMQKEVCRTHTQSELRQAHPQMAPKPKTITNKPLCAAMTTLKSAIKALENVAKTEVGKLPVLEEEKKALGEKIKALEKKNHELEEKCKGLEQRVHAHNAAALYDQVEHFIMNQSDIDMPIFMCEVNQHCAQAFKKRKTAA